MQWTVGQEPSRQTSTREGDYIDTARDGFVGFMNKAGGYRIMSGDTQLLELGSDQDGWGRLSPDTQWLTFDDPANFALLALPTGKPVDLPLPDDWFVAGVEWTPNNRLVVSGSDDEAADPGMRSFVCEPEAATCEEYPKRSLPYAMTNGARGYFVLTQPADFDQTD